jgi:hypothetical protein
MEKFAYINIFLLLRCNEQHFQPRIGRSVRGEKLASKIDLKLGFPFFTMWWMLSID